MKRKIRSNSMHIFRLHFLHSIRLISVNVRLIRLFSLSLFVGILFHLLTMSITLQILEFNRHKRRLFLSVCIYLMTKDKNPYPFYSNSASIISHSLPTMYPLLYDTKFHTFCTKLQGS